MNRKYVFQKCFTVLLLLTLITPLSTFGNVFKKPDTSIQENANSEHNTDSESEETIKLYSDHIGYDQSRKIVIATSNVKLEYKNIQISGEKLSMDVEQNLVWGSGKINIKRGEDEFESNGIMVDLDNEIVTLNGINISILPPKELNNKSKTNEKLYIRVQTLRDTPDYKTGINGYISACSNPQKKQHNYIWARSFTYEPDKRLTMYNVVFYNKFLFIPTYFWLPVYTYALGPRKIVWNFPTIGKKEDAGWGWFIQNSIDYKYENGKDSSVLIDWYETKNDRKGNWGYGIRHNYLINNHDGRFYYYNYDYSEQNSESIQNLSNTIKEWKNTYKWDEKWTLSHYISDIKVDQKINSIGSDYRLNKGLALKYDDLGDVLQTSYDESDNNNTNVQFKKYTLNRSFNNQTQYAFNFSETDTIKLYRKDVNSSGEYNLNLPYQTQFKSEFTYSSFDENWKNTTPADTTLITKFTAQKKVNDKLDFEIKIDQLMDLDSSKVTTDATGRNNYLHKLPEINLKLKNIRYKKINFTQSTTLAKYREIRFDNITDKTRDYSESANSLEPNTYIFKQGLSTSISDLPLKSTWTLNTGYDQYVFKTENKNLFEGDALYLFSLNTGIKSDFLGFIQTETAYKSRYAPKENNSPFFQFQQSTSEENAMSQSIAFYYNREKLKFFPYFFGVRWENGTEYSWIREKEKWGLYTTRATLKLTKMLTVGIDTAKKLNYDQTSAKTRFNPLHFSIDVLPSANFKCHYDLSMDLNKWRDDNIKDVRNSNFTLGFTLGKTEDYEWQLETGFVYQKEATIENGLRFEQYQLQTLNILKREHERDLIIGYNKLNQEIRILYRFNVFPNDPLELVKRKNIWTIEGRFKQNSEERFNSGT